MSLRPRRDTPARAYTECNADGIRTRKSVNGGTTRYVVNGTQVLFQQTGISEPIYFEYDANGHPYSMTYSNTKSFYLCNQYGDVLALLNESGDKIAEYTYGPYGQILSVTGSHAYTLGAINPFRYRGYYYDDETGLYYLNSRYYDPEVGRFINADGQISTGDISGTNLFAYCGNNPVNMSDSDGNMPKWLSGVLTVVGGALQVKLGAALGATTGWTGIGAVAAGFLILNGTATITQGVGQIINSVAKSNVLREDNAIRTAVKDIGGAIGGRDGAVIAGSAYDATVVAASLYAGTVKPKASACFIAGTVVLLSSGKKAIEEIRAGDTVWAKNPETGEKELKKVVRTFVNETSELIHVRVNGETITATPEHPFYIPSKGWTTAIELRAGDILVMQNGEYLTIEKIQHEILESPVTVYNFEVEGFHTYYVGNNSVLVHNTCKKFTPDQQAVLDLAKENKNGLSSQNAQTLWEWAQEYEISGHGPMSGHGKLWQGWHIKIKNTHISIFPE